MWSSRSRLVRHLVADEDRPAGAVLITSVPSSSRSIVQPTIGTISDYTITPLGSSQAVHRHRRDPRRPVPPGIATSRTIAIAAFVVLLQFSSNFAQGPFQGYVPDLVRRDRSRSPVRSWGSCRSSATWRASSSAARRRHQSIRPWPDRLGVLEVTTMLSVVIRVREGGTPSLVMVARGGRSPPRPGARTSCANALPVARRFAARCPHGRRSAHEPRDLLTGPNARDEPGRAGTSFDIMVGLVAVGTVIAAFPRRGHRIASVARRSSLRASPWRRSASQRSQSRNRSFALIGVVLYGLSAGIFLPSIGRS